MNINELAQLATEVLGGFYALCSIVALVAPKDSTLGLLAARFSADFKKAHTPAGAP